MALKRTKTPAAELREFTGSNGNKSTFIQRLQEIDKFLKGESAASAEPDETCSYEEFRTEVAKAFASRFNMKPDGAVKSVGDTVGVLKLRQVNAKNEEVIVLRSAAERVAKALEIASALPATTEEKEITAAVCKAVGVPVPQRTTKRK